MKRLTCIMVSMVLISGIGCSRGGGSSKSSDDMGSGGSKESEDSSGAHSGASSSNSSGSARGSVEPVDETEIARLAKEWDRRRAQFEQQEQQLLDEFYRKRDDVSPSMALATLTLDHRQNQCVALSPDGKMLAVGSGLDLLNKQHDRTIKLVDLKSQKIVKTLKSELDAVDAVLFSADGKVLISSESGEDTGIVRYWDTDAWSELKSIPVAKVTHLSLSPDGKTLAVSGGYEKNALELWDAGTGELKKRLGREEFQGFGRAAFSPDGKLVAFGDIRHQVHICAVATGKEARALDCGGWVAALEFSPDGAKLAVGGMTETMVQIWNAREGTLIQKLDAPPASRCLSFSPDGKVFVAGGSNNVGTSWFVVYDGKTFKPLRKFNNEVSYPFDLAFSPGGKLFFSADAHEVKIWDAQELASGDKDLSRNILEKMGEVQRAEDGFHLKLKSRATDEDLAGLADAKYLVSLQVPLFNEVTDAGLAKLKGLPRLRQLNLEYMDKLTDTGLAQIGELHQITVLELGPISAVTNEGLQHLEGLTALKSLAVRCQKIDGVGLVHLKGLSNLERLNLGGVKVGDEGMAHLAGLTKLTHLTLWGAKLSDAGLVHLKDMVHMKSLLLSDNPITGTGLKHIKDLSDLQELDLNNTGLTDAGLEPLHGLKKLQSLKLQNTKVTQQGLDKIKAALPGVEVILGQ